MSGWFRFITVNAPESKKKWRPSQPSWLDREPAVFWIDVVFIGTNSECKNFVPDPNPVLVLGRMGLGKLQNSNEDAAECVQGWSGLLMRLRQPLSKSVSNLKG
jgi:hypothetical protein